VKPELSAKVKTLLQRANSLSANVTVKLGRAKLDEILKKYRGHTPASMTEDELQGFIGDGEHALLSIPKK
jgi:hypothetical protein